MHHYFRKGSWLIKVCCFLLFFYALPSFSNVTQSPAVKAYIAELHNKYGFSTQQLNHWFSQVQFNQSIIEKMNQPYKAAKPTPWYEYRARFVTPTRIQKGVEFWNANAAALAQAQKQYGVAAQTIVAIFGIETNYGENKGNYSALEALTTFAFYHPKRKAYFRNELTEFLLLTRQEGWDPLTIKSSFDGGLGYPQFMPSSYRTYAVNADHTGGSDLFNDRRDAIASIANYLQKKGWQPNQPIAAQAKLLGSQYEEKNYRELLTQNGKPQFTLAELALYGLEPLSPAPQNLPVGILFLDYGEQLIPWITFPNYAVIKKYNTQANYVMVANELGQKISEARK